MEGTQTGRLSPNRRTPVVEAAGRISHYYLAEPISTRGGCRQDQWIAAQGVAIGQLEGVSGWAGGGRGGGGTNKIKGIHLRKASPVRCRSSGVTTASRRNCIVVEARAGAWLCPRPGGVLESSHFPCHCGDVLRLQLPCSVVRRCLPVPMQHRGCQRPILAEPAAAVHLTLHQSAALIRARGKVPAGGEVS